jgi:GxxExxY protein
MTRSTQDPSVLIEADITEPVIGAFFSVYNQMGFGFLESFYSNALAIELQYRGLAFAREVKTEVVYRGVPIGLCRFDLVVENRVLVEIKSSKAIIDGDERQIQNYLKASRIEVGLLLHFGPEPNVRRFIFTNDRK